MGFFYFYCLCFLLLTLDSSVTWFHCEPFQQRCVEIDCVCERATLFAALSFSLSL